MIEHPRPHRGICDPATSPGPGVRDSARAFVGRNTPAAQFCSKEKQKYKGGGNYLVIVT